MQTHKVVSKEEWLAARQAYLAKEKEFTSLRDQLSAERRALPWEKVDQQYVFDTADGKRTLAQLFGERSQLLVYHFMLGPNWNEGCPSCSFWADNYNGVDIHLRHRDIQLLALSRAPLAQIEAYKKRMGWSFNWASSLSNSFNQDYCVSFSAEELKGEVYYNYQKRSFPSEEAPGISVFYKDESGDVFHTYSCYARGLDMVNGAYHLMDLTPKGRDEADLRFSMAWVRRHDQYTD